MASDKIKNTTDNEFAQDVLAGDTPVVDFWATWCGPCRAMAPHLDAIATELDGKVRIVKIDVDRNQKTAVTYGVQSLPTLLVFRNGAVVDKLVGNPNSKVKLMAFVSRNLSAQAAT